ncbi:MAG: hypothetical protein H0X33_04525 [Taibaiella sp.]|nr:hypothetical protein [Taibaiella sp.]
MKKASLLLASLVPATTMLANGKGVYTPHFIFGMSPLVMLTIFIVACMLIPLSRIIKKTTSHNH